MWCLEQCRIQAMTPRNCWLSVTAALSWGPRAGNLSVLPCPTISPAHKLPAGSAVWLVVPHPSALCSQIICLPVSFANLASPGLSDSVTAFIPSTGVCISPSFLLPKFLLRLAPISSRGKNSGYRSICALYKKMPVGSAFISQSLSLELRHLNSGRGMRLGQGCPEFGGLIPALPWNLRISSLNTPA